MIVILYVIDSLRPDFLGCYGYARNISPNIDALARDGILYHNAYSTAVWTKPSAASIITSQYPRSLGVMHEMSIMPDYEHMLPKTLKEHGYNTYAISANTFFSPFFGFSGFDEFFVLSMDKELLRKREKVKDPDQANPKIFQIWKKYGIDKFIKPLSEDINEKLLPIIINKGGNKLIIAWSNDTHRPYYAFDNKSFFGDSPQYHIALRNTRNIEKMQSLYCDMIRYNDSHIGELILRLKEEGMYENSLIVVTGDHGESFGEHSIVGRPITQHGGIPYEEVIKIPLLIKYPQNKHSGMRCEALVQLIDIYPTILKVCGIQDNIEMEGISLYPEHDNLKEDRTIFVESQKSPHHIYSAAIIKGDYKLIKIDRKLQVSLNWRTLARSILFKFMPEFQLFNLRFDPKERQNLSKKQKSCVEMLTREHRKLHSELERKERTLRIRQETKRIKTSVKRLKAKNRL